jgi:hypothetical protein
MRMGFGRMLTRRDGLYGKGVVGDLAGEARRRQHPHHMEALAESCTEALHTIPNL